MRREHETVEVDLNGRLVDIDVGIAPLIKALWRARIETVMSCEANGERGWVWVEFASCAGAEEFLDIVARYEQGIDSLYNRIRHGWDWIDDRKLDTWEYSVHPWDRSIEQTVIDDAVDEVCTGPADFVLTCSVRFPPSDLDTVVERVKAFTPVCTCWRCRRLPPVN